MASHYMCIMNYACYKDDLQDAKHMVTYIICFMFACRRRRDHLQVLVDGGSGHRSF